MKKYENEKSENNSIKNNIIKRNKQYFDNIYNNEFNIKDNNSKFSSKRVKLNRGFSENISRNPNLNNYSKNKKLFIPINVMNLVSFINSKTNNADNSISTLSIISKIQSYNGNWNNNLKNNNVSKVSLNNNSDSEGEEILKKKEDNNYLNDNNILAQTASSKEEESPFSIKNDLNQNFVSFNNNWINKDNQYNNNLNSIQKEKEDNNIIEKNNKSPEIIKRKQNIEDIINIQKEKEEEKKDNEMKNIILKNQQKLREEKTYYEELYHIPKEKEEENNEIKDVVVQNTINLIEEESNLEKLIDIPKEKEKDKYNNMKNKVDNTKKVRKKNQKPENITDQKTNIKINNVLEDMCKYGAIIKREIKREKINNPEKFIDISQALKMENEDPGLFALGLISKNLEDLGVETVIEDKQIQDKLNEGLTGLQFLTNGMISKKKYDLHFEFGEQRNNELINNKSEFEKFKENLKLKLSKDYNIPKEKIIVTLPQKGSFHVQVIFQSEEFHNLDKKEFIKKFKNDPEFKELKHLKDIHEGVIMEGVKLSRNQLDPAGNRVSGWGVGEKRGGIDYDPPLGWTGIGLKVKGKFDKGDDTWIGMSNIQGEWCVAYHGVGDGKSSDDVKKITGLIYKSRFKKGERQKHSKCDDQFHPGKKVGDGVYCTPTIKTAEMYAGKSEIHGHIYKTVLMVRVKPSARRHCDTCWDSKAHNYWVVNGTIDEIRPYRILYKKCD